MRCAWQMNGEPICKLGLAGLVIRGYTKPDPCPLVLERRSAVGKSFPYATPSRDANKQAEEATFGNGLET